MAATLDVKDEQKPAEVHMEEKESKKNIEEEEKSEVEDDEKPVENGKMEDDDTEENTEDEDDKDKDGEKNDEEDDGESSEEELGSLEKPVEIIGRKRERKSTERFAEKKGEEKKKQEDDLDYTKGKGIKLGDIPFIKHSLDRTLCDDLKPLHRLLYRVRSVKSTIIKKNIRAFCGFPFEKDSVHYTKMLSQLDRFNNAGLKFLCGLIGLEKKGDREEVKERIFEFLMEPKDLGKEIPQKKPKAAKKKTPKKKSSSQKTPGSSKKKEKKSSENADDVSAASDDSDDEGEKEKEHQKKPSPKKKESKDKKKKPTPVKIAAPKKKTPKKTTPKKKEAKRKNMQSDSEDDEPLVKKTKSEPTNEDVHKVVATILKDADLEQVTMKTVCKQVYEHFPDFDLTGRKDFIKATVKEIIS